MKNKFFYLLVLFLLSFYSEDAKSKTLTYPIFIGVDSNFQKLLSEQDTDHDNKITIEDIGSKVFYIKSILGQNYELNGTYYLSNFLMQLAIAKDDGKKILLLRPEYLYENPVRRTSRMIKDIFWNGLTRTIDEQHLPQILKDSKLQNQENNYLYIPFNDSDGFEYFSQIAEVNKNLNLKIEVLPSIITGEYVKNLDNKHGLLSLAITKDGNSFKGVPFVVPGGRFNEMYGWDTYFINLGLINDGKYSLAKSNVDNFMYELEFYGKILNANRTYYLTRSQPPFFTSMMMDVYKILPDESWLQKALALAIEEHNNIWFAAPKLTETGLSRYFDIGGGIPPEVEPDHFDWLLSSFAEKYQLTINEFKDKYSKGEIKEPALNEYFIHDRCMRESGHDTTYRWTINGEDLCADFVTVDLNSLLYKMELDIARCIEKVFNGTFNLKNDKTTSSDYWYNLAKDRKKLIRQYLWNSDRNMFFDYNIKDKLQNYYISATTFYPLWTIYSDYDESKILNDDEASKLIKTALSYLEAPGGILASALLSKQKAAEGREDRQWDYPYGWAPHQIITWRALLNYGFKEDAHRLIYKWLYTIVKNAADYNGTIPEKYDVISRSHKVFISYGNVGTEFDYITQEGFGWMNASFQIGLSLLPDNLLSKLEKLIPPEDIF
jgi:alpha,alpha-trehalase